MRIVSKLLPKKNRLAATGLLMVMMSLVLLTASAFLAAPGAVLAAYQNIELDSVGNTGAISLHANSAADGYVVWSKYDGTDTRKLWLQTYAGSPQELDALVNPTPPGNPGSFSSVEVDNGQVFWKKYQSSTSDDTLKLWDGSSTVVLDTALGSASFYDYQFAAGKAAWIKWDGVSQYSLWFWNGSTKIPLTAESVASPGYLGFVNSFQGGALVWTKTDGSTYRSLRRYTGSGTSTLGTVGYGGSFSAVAYSDRVLWSEYDSGTLTYTLKLLDVSGTHTLDTVSGSGNYISSLRLSGDRACWTKTNSGTCTLRLWDGTTTTDLDTTNSGWLSNPIIDQNRVAWSKYDTSTTSYTLWLKNGTTAKSNLDTSESGGSLSLYAARDGRVLWQKSGSTTDTLSLNNGTSTVTLDTCNASDEFMASYNNMEAGRVAWYKWNTPSGTYTVWLHNGTTPTLLDTITSPSYLAAITSDAGHVVWSKLQGVDYRLLLSDQPPQQPSNVSPTTGAGASLTPTLSSSGYSDEEGDSHLASQWQVTTTAGNYSSPAYDSLVDATHLTSITVPADKLTGGTPYYWRVRYQDYWGQWSAYSTETSFTANRDPNPPSNASPSDNSSVSTTPTLQSSAFSDPDAGNTHAASQWQVTATKGSYSGTIYDSGADTTHPISITIPSGTLSGGQTYYWHVRHRDNFGFWSSYSVETSFFTDGTPPAVTITALAPDPTSTTTPTLTGTATDTYTAIDLVEYRVDGGSWIEATFTASSSDPKTGTYTFTASALTDGSHTVQVRATDDGGNVTTSYASDTFTVDTVAGTVTPSETIIKTKDNTPTLTGTVSDNTSAIASVEYRVDSGGWQKASFTADAVNPNAGTYTLTTFLPKGNHTVQVRAVDAAGNTDETKYASISLAVSAGTGVALIIIIVIVVLIVGGVAGYLIWRYRGKLKEKAKERIDKAAG